MNSEQTPSVGGAVDLSHLVAAGERTGAAGAASVPGAPGAPAGSGNGAGEAEIEVPALVFDVTDNSFQEVAALSATVPVVIDLWAEWCGPCKTLGPLLEKLTEEFEGRLLLGKVDVDQNPGLAQAFQVQSIPAVFALVGG